MGSIYASYIRSNSIRLNTMTASFWKDVARKDILHGMSDKILDHRSLSRSLENPQLQQ